MAQEWLVKVLRNADKRSKPRKVREFLRDNGGVIVGIVLFSLGFLLYCIVEFLKVIGVVK